MAGSKKLKIWNERILMIMQQEIDRGTTQQEFLEGIDFVATNIGPVRKGERGFTVEQIYNVCHKYKINPSWIFGFSPEMKIKPAKNAVQQLEEAVVNIKAEIARK
jgi:hypothetical protein